MIRGATLAQKIDAYQRALRRYRVEDIMTAGHKCLDTFKRFPLPAEIVEAMDLHEDHDKKSDFNIMESGRCAKCGRVGSVIDEPKNSGFYRCKQCYSGLTILEIKQRFSDLAMMMAEPKRKPDWYYTVRGADDVPY